MNRFLARYKTGLMAALFLSALGITSCKKDDDKSFQLSRFFSPGVITPTAGETSVSLQWRPSLLTEGIRVEYTVEVAKDTLFANGAELSKVVSDSTRVIFSDSELDIKVKYFARIKANELGETKASNWTYSPSFMITGEQIFSAILDTELKDKSVTLRWRSTSMPTKIRLTPTGGTAVDYPIGDADRTNAALEITGLSPNTTYSAEIYQGNLVKGVLSFTTKEPSLYTVELEAGADIAAAVAAAASGDVIGLKAGAYSLPAALEIVGKNISIVSITGDPATTVVNFKQVKLVGTGAGVTLRGIDFNGTANAADYFLNFGGAGGDGNAADFANVSVENCIVRNVTTSFIRANRGSSAGVHTINEIKVSGCMVYNLNASNSGFDCVLLDRLKFTKVDITNSTFTDFGRAFISASTTVSGPIPEVNVSGVTLNYFGAGSRRVLFDANANPVKFTLSNSIVGNTPKAGAATLSPDLVRATGVGATVTIQHTNLFNLQNGESAALNIPAYVSVLNNTNVVLDWNATTTNFTLPVGSPLRTAGLGGGPIGDPRWAL